MVQYFSQHKWQIITQLWRASLPPLMSCHKPFFCVCLMCVFVPRPVHDLSKRAVNIPAWVGDQKGRGETCACIITQHSGPWISWARSGAVMSLTCFPKAYHLRREETDWFDKPREVRQEDGHVAERRQGPHRNQQGDVRGGGRYHAGL